MIHVAILHGVAQINRKRMPDGTLAAVVADIIADEKVGERLSVKGGPTRYAKRKLKRWLLKNDAPDARFLLTGKSFGGWNIQEALRAVGALRGEVAVVFVDAQHLVADQSHVSIEIPPVAYCHSLRQLGFMAGHRIFSEGACDKDTVLADPWTHANIDRSPAVRDAIEEAIDKLSK